MVVFVIIVVALLALIEFIVLPGPSRNVNGEIDECIGCPYRKYGTSYCEENCKWFDEINNQ